MLGPVRAWRREESLPTGSSQQRALLAELLPREGRKATAAEPIDALGAEEPPSQALDPHRRLELRRFRGLWERGAMSPSERAGGAKARLAHARALRSGSPVVQRAPLRGAPKAERRGSGSATAP